MLEQSDIPLFLCRWLCLKVGLKSRQSIDYSAFSSTSFSFRIFSATALARDNFSRFSSINETSPCGESM